MNIETPSHLKIREIIQSHSSFIEDPSSGNPADLSELNLFGFKFENLNLTGVNFTGSRLTQCIFSNCILVGADFDGSFGSVAFFDECEMDGTSWVGAEITSSLVAGCSLIGANMFDANFSETKFLRTDLSESNLANTKLLESEFNYVDLNGVVGNKENIISMQVGGYDVTYTDSILQIGKHQKTIQEWKSVWMSKDPNAVELHVLMNVANFALEAIHSFPAKPTTTSEI
ncbi:TPA: pentapeptide repeat-containing protein [Vibrio parahaemolyticus]